MKTLLKYLIILTAMILTKQADSQSVCHDTIVFLNNNGLHVLSPRSVLNPTLSDEYDAFISPSIFTCANLGRNTVDVLVTFEGDTVFQCFASVTVKESVLPVAQCTSQIHVVLDTLGEYPFTFDELDAGSYNQCERFGYKIEPPRITCGATNPTFVNLIIRDHSDQYDTCVIEVSWDEHSGPYPPFACKSNATVESFVGEFHEGEKVMVTADMILEGSPLRCRENYAVIILENGIARPKPEITLADTNNILFATVIELSTGEDCTSPITIVGVSACEETFSSCDTASRCTPIGDCASGHTDQDNLEWPCDFTIPDVCYSQNLDITPEAIRWFHYGEPGDAQPTYHFPTFCNSGFLFEGYWDQEIPLPTGKHILRHWTVLNWLTAQVFEYIQIIKIEYRKTVICDTLPWNAPVGDCDSGHTLTDNVEWPADISIESFYSHPDDLAQNPNVLPQDVHPQLIDSCSVLSKTFHDVVTELNDSTLLVERTWSIRDFLTQEVWMYTQNITILFNPNGSLVCVTRESGEPIPGVELTQGIETETTGCYLFENPDGIIVTPYKDSPLQEGVNILDEILLVEFTLNLRSPGLYQRIAADLNWSQALSAIDIIEMRKLRAGILQPSFPRVWYFREQTTQATSANISNPLVPYKFIGVKMGDLDNSFVLTSPQDREDMFLLAEDEVLTSGETYLIPVYPDRNDSIVGFAVKMKNISGNIEFLDVVAPGLPGFDISNHVRFDPNNNTVTIEWIAPIPQIQAGVEMSTLEPLFFLQIRSHADLLLREEMTLESNFDHLLKPRGDDPAFDLRLNYEDIINSIVKLEDGRSISFYPNPTSDEIQIKGPLENEIGTVTITDATGRIIINQRLESRINLRSLQSGMYYVSFTIDGMATYATPLVFIQ